MGRAIALRLAEQGATVWSTTRRRVGGRRGRQRSRGLSVPCDVSDRSAIEGQIVRCEREVGPIDLLVANHAFMTMALLEQHSEADVWRMLEVNLLGTAGVLEMRSRDGQSRIWPDRRDLVGMGADRLAERDRLRGHEGSDHRVGQERRTPVRA